MKRLALASGLVLLAMIWLGPLLDEWRASFAAHMVAHMGVVAAAAPLIAWGLPQGRRFRNGMPPALPLAASLAELAIVWGWHAPVMRAAAQSSAAVTAIEQVMFLAAGLLLWRSSLVPGPRAHAAMGALALLATSIHMTLLGALLALSQRPLFGAGQVSCFGVVLDGLQDQEFGGVIMLLAGAVVYLAGGLFLVSRLLTADDGGKRSPAGHSEGG